MIVKQCDETTLLIAGDQILVKVPHGLPLLVVEQHVGPSVLHSLHSLLRTPLRMLRHQVTTNQGGAPVIRKISIEHQMYNVHWIKELKSMMI